MRRRNLANNLNTDDLNQHPKKGAYEPPRLFSYGNVREIAQNVGKAGKADSGVGSSMDKTG